MVYFALKLGREFSFVTDGLLTALDTSGVSYKTISNTSDIWLRDFMPIKTRSGRWISFRYEPSYLNDTPERRTNYRKEIAPKLQLPVIYSDINLDGGNVVFSPSKSRVIISDRVFWENRDKEPAALVRELEQLLEAQVIIIPSLKSDFTGHADGMVRFVNEYTAIGNRVDTKNGLEQQIRRVLIQHGIDVLDFPYESSRGISAEGCYLNFLETDTCIFLPKFGRAMDREVIAAATRIFPKTVVPVEIGAIAREGGGLNCISWEM